jgi:hypothetical protein
MFAPLLALIISFSANAGAVPLAPAEPPATKQKPSANDCILYATIFTDQGRLLEGAEIRVHPDGKKKPNYEAISDRRGEFAVRVPTVGDFEIEIKAEGFVTQTRKVTTVQGQKLEMIFHMARPTPPEKKK